MGIFERRGFLLDLVSGSLSESLCRSARAGCRHSVYHVFLRPRSLTYLLRTAHGIHHTSAYYASVHYICTELLTFLSSLHCVLNS